MRWTWEDTADMIKDTFRGVVIGISVGVVCGFMGMIFIGCESAVDKETAGRREVFRECTDKIPRALMDLENGSYADAVYECREVSYKAVPYGWRGK